MKGCKTCNNLIVSCMDFRIQGYVRSWVERQFAGQQYDYVGFAGSSKEIDIVSSQVDISVRLHKIKKVILIHHEDCGAYGTQGSFETHVSDLQNAKQHILQKYPDLIVDAFFLKLTGNFLQVC